MQAYIEHIYGDTARVLFDEDESVGVMIPVSALPRDASEGTVLRVKFNVDPAATEARKRRQRSGG